MICEGIEPDVITYNSIIRGVCSLGMWKVAECYVNKMVNYGVSPNIVTFNIMIDALCKDGEDRKGTNSIGVDAYKKCKSDVVTYSSLIDGYAIQANGKKQQSYLENDRSWNLTRCYYFNIY
ncbi:hypothetical protein GIB67_004946 [Kingdonia uniflora]|uniref:Pentatricopeptide repeat-containing protein n=1 Tax=Kingdonia uniflora TaxID=39325 RepID=A0A7J7MMP6_9MAGN|nr:hypothetical protein GIB67_004946 [Kingdonia uniflora]